MQVVIRSRGPQALPFGGIHDRGGQRVKGSGQVVNSQLAVDVQGQLGVAVPSQLLRYLHRRAGFHQQRDVRHAQGMEVRHAPSRIDVGQKLGFLPALAFRLVGAGFVDPRGPGGAQVSLQHPRGLLRHIEDWSIRGPAVQPFEQQVGQVLADRLHVLAPALRACGLQDDCGLVVIQSKAGRS